MPAQRAAVAIQLWPVTISIVYRTFWAEVKNKEPNVNKEIVSVSCHLDAISVLGLKISQITNLECKTVRMYYERDRKFPLSVRAAGFYYYN